MSSTIPSPAHSKGSPWNRWIIVVASLIALAIVGRFALERALQRFLDGQGLLRQISQRTADSLHAPTGYLPLQWHGASVSSAGLLARDEGGHSLTELRARDMNARLNLSGLWQKQLHIERIDAQHLQAAFGPDAAKLLVQDLPGSPMLVAPVAGGASPFTVDVAELAVEKTDLFWGQPKKSDGALREITTRFWPDRKNLVVIGYGGRLAQRGFPETKVCAFQLYYEKPTLRIDAGTLTLGDRGQIDVTGKFQFTKPGVMDLALRFRRCSVGPFLSEESRSKFEGMFKSNTQIRQELGSDKAASVEGDISVEGGLLKGIAALEKIAALTGEPRFRKLKLQEISAKFHWNAPELSVEDFVAESKGLLRVEGEFRVKNETIHGSFQLGVTAEVLKSIPGAREEVFKKERDGYFWTPVRLEGPVNNPRQDLKERLVAGAKRYYEKMILAPLQLILKPGREIIEKLQELF
jgi:hypothetical protein